MQTDFGFGEDDDAWDGVFQIVRCRRALSPSGLPGIDYALNPYGGCEHGCIYCYAPEVTHNPWDGWRVVRVRKDIPERLVKELPGLSGVIGIGTVTDPYQGAEARFHLTHRCLEILCKAGFPVRIHTKSPLVLRDVDILRRMDSAVEVTLTGFDRRTSLRLEPGAPLPEERFHALRVLVDSGIDSYALVEPVLDCLSGHEEEFCDMVAATGVRTARVGGLNGRPELNARMSKTGITSSSRTELKIRVLLRERGLKVIDAI